MIQLIKKLSSQEEKDDDLEMSKEDEEMEEGEDEGMTFVYYKSIYMYMQFDLSFSC